MENALKWWSENFPEAKCVMYSPGMNYINLRLFLQQSYDNDEFQKFQEKLARLGKSAPTNCRFNGYILVRFEDSWS